MSSTDDLRRLAQESRMRLAALGALREQQRLITSRSRRCLDASRLLLAGADRDREAVAALPAGGRTAPPPQV